MRYVRLMADFCSSGLWGADGCMLMPAEVPVPEDLGADIEAWVDNYDRNCKDYLDPDDAGYVVFDTESHAAAGLVLARRLKEALPEWTVVYFDEFKMQTSDAVPRTTYEFEIEVQKVSA